MNFRQYDENRAKDWAAKFSLPVHIARLLSARLKDDKEVRSYIEPSLNQLNSPSLLPDIEPLIAQIEATIKKKEPILIYGHDDVDGFSSVAVLYDVLTDLGARIFYHIPNRIRDGYFFNPELLEKFKSEGVNLILTADFGSSNPKNFEIAETAGMKLLVTDHHEIIHQPIHGPTVNPKRPDSRYPFRELAGVGVAYKVAQAIACRLLDITSEEFSSIKFDILGPVMLGTIADRVPLIDENRIFSKFGLDALKKTTRPVIRKLVNRLPEEKFNYATIFSDILPFISSGRENQGVAIFLIKDEVGAEEMVKALRRQNELWQSQVRNAYNEAFSAAHIYDHIVISLLVNGPIHCLGSCATRLRDNFNRPAIVMGFTTNHQQADDEQEKPICVGELRGNDGSDLIALLKYVQDTLIDFGGHRKAAGFSMYRTCLDEFTEQAKIYAEEHFVSSGAANNKNFNLVVDMIWPMDKIDSAFKIFLPFGEGNPPPILYDESGILYTFDENLNPIDPHRFARIPRETVNKHDQSALSGRS